MSAHAKLSPSASSRWATCLASTGFIEANEARLPADNSSAAADEGTLAHSHAAEALVMGYDATSFADQIMAAHVKSYVDYVEGHSTGTAEIHVEERVPLFYSKAEGGTVDAWLLEETCLHIFDLKYGVGVTVEAEGNTQLAIYAESLIQKIGGVSMEFNVKLHIVQPRAREGDPIKVWELTRRELQDFCDPLEEAVRQIRAAKTEPDFVLDFTPSDKACRWCRAKAICTARAQKESVQIPVELADDLFGINYKVSALPEDVIARIAKASLDGGLVKWLTDVTDYAQELVMAGGLQGMGLKVVAAKTHRKWADEVAALKLLRQKVSSTELLTQDLVSPSQAEKLLKGIVLSAKFNNKLNALISKADGAPKLATEDDKRPALQPITAATEFPPEEDLM